jgi:hypothetical protein
MEETLYQGVAFGVAVMPYVVVFIAVLAAGQLICELHWENIWTSIVSHIKATIKKVKHEVVVCGDDDYTNVYDPKNFTATFTVIPKEQTVGQETNQSQSKIQMCIDSNSTSKLTPEEDSQNLKQIIDLLKKFN